MESWKKVLIGGVAAAAAALIGGIGYMAYQNKKNKEAKNEKIKDQEKGEPDEEIREDDVPDKGGRKNDDSEIERFGNPYDIIEESLTECLDSLIKSSEQAKKIPAEKKAEYKKTKEKEIEFIIYSGERTVCQRKCWNLEDYYEEVKQLETAKDPKILSYLQKIEKLIQNVLNGEPLEFRFELAPELTMEVTAILYKRIMLSHLFLYHQKIQEYYKLHETANEEEIEEVKLNAESIKILRRTQLAERYKISKKPSEDYKIAILKGYYTYKLSSELFSQELEELFSIHGSLEKMLSEKKQIEELSIDPFSMTDDEFAEYYRSLQRKFSNPKTPSVSPAEVLSALKVEDKPLDPPKKVE